MNLFDSLNSAIRNSEASLVNLLSAIAPWAAPIAPAYMSFFHMTGVLAFPEWVAGSVAVVVEVLGLSTISTAIAFWAHNKRYRTEFRKAPVWVAVTAFVSYLSIVLTVNVLLEATQAKYALILAKGLLTLMSVPAAIILAVRTQHTNLIDEMREDKDRRRQDKGDRSQTVRFTKKNEQFSEQRPHRSKIAEMITEYINQRFDETGQVPGPREIERALNVSVSHASKVRNEWIEYMNQNGN